MIPVTMRLKHRRAVSLLSIPLILAMAISLSNCSGISTDRSALPTVVLGNNPVSAATPTDVPFVGLSSGVTASGVVAPAQAAQLAFAISGKIDSLAVAAGDSVQSGQVLAHLAGGEQLQAALSAAELNVLSAGQALNDFQEPQPLKIAQAQSALDKARTAYDDLVTPPQTAVTQAQKNILDAQKALEDAQRAVDIMNHRGSPSQIAQAQSDLVLAQQEVDHLQDVYNETTGDPAVDAPKALAYTNLEKAIARRDRAQANLNWLTSKPTQLEADQTNNDLAVAKANLADAQKKLNDLTNPSAVDVALAKAAVDDAQKVLDDLQAGPDPEQLALLQARLKNAQDQVKAAQASLDSLELKAPFSGTIGLVNHQAGEWILAGQPVLVLADLEHLRIETTDLSEKDISKVQVGQPVTISVKALSQDLTGHVKEIMPLADTLGGDVVYKTILELDAPLSGLRAGMSVKVQFNTGP